MGGIAKVRRKQRRKGWFTKERDPLEQFTHLVRLGRDLHRIGVGTTLVLPVTGQPILEVVSMGRTRIRVVVVRRAREWVFIWRPWWARIWMPGSWVWAEADNAADIVAAAAIT